jgi:eukaryotic-like serine/threonine-protein kinase
LQGKTESRNSIVETRSGTLGKYRLIAELGRGGMADVYLAVSQGLGGFNKMLVLKQLRPLLAEEHEFVTMFLDEARLAARLNHPNIVQTYEVGEDDNRYFIAMEFLEGQSLNRLIHRAERLGGLPSLMYLQVIAQALQGLHYAHELKDYDGTPLGIVHRDMSPHNVFITYTGDVKIVDFGIAKAHDSKSETGTGVVKGKIAYMSPEQARSQRVDRRADIFSAGVMIWEALAHHRMWKGVEDLAVLDRLTTGDLPPSDPAVRTSPEQLRKILFRALALSPEDRYDSALQLQGALEDFLRKQGSFFSARAVGEHVSKLFRKERERIGLLIEQRLLHFTQLPTAGEPTVALPRIHSASMMGSHPGASAEIDAQARKALMSDAPPDLAPQTGSLVSTTVDEAGVRAASFRRVRMLAAVSTVGALVAIAGAWGLRARISSVPAETPAIACGSAPLAATPSAEASGSAMALLHGPIQLRFTAIPPNARLLFDGELLPGNPYTAVFNRDDKPHQLRAEADGYTPVTKELRLDRPAAIEITLQRAHAGAVIRPMQPPAAESAQPVEPPDPDKLAPKKKPRRPIDTENPWSP